MNVRPKIENEPITKKVFALLDIDGTIISSDGLKFNECVLEQLKEKNIVDVIFFSTMTSATVITDADTYMDHKELGYTRAKIIEKFKAQNFNVHFVMTPMDCADDTFLPGQVYEEYLDPLYKQIISLRNKQIDENDDADFLRKMGELRDFFNIATERNVKQHADMRDMKGLMYKKLSEHLPKECGSFVYFEDSKNCRDAVGLSHKELSTSENSEAIAALITILNEKEFIPFDNRCNPPQYKKDNAEKISNALDKHIAALPDNLKKDHQLCAEFNAFSRAIEHIPVIYKKLGHKDYQKRAEQLAKECKAITNSANSTHEKFKQLIEKLESVHLENRNRFSKKFFFFWMKRPAFSDYLNKDIKNHHFSRLIALTLKQLYTTNPLIPSVKCSDVHRINRGKDDYYYIISPPTKITISYMGVTAP